MPLKRWRVKPGAKVEVRTGHHFTVIAKDEEGAVEQAVEAILNGQGEVVSETVHVEEA